MRLLFKIIDGVEWQRAVAAGRFEGSAIDSRDGFIHLSAVHQVRETAAKHFGGQHGLVLVAFAENRLSGLKWESSRGGALFPHVYGAIDTRQAAWMRPLPLVDGLHQFPPEADL